MGTLRVSTTLSIVSIYLLKKQVDVGQYVLRNFFSETFYSSSECACLTFPP